MAQGSCVRHLAVQFGFWLTDEEEGEVGTIVYKALVEVLLETCFVSVSLHLRPDQISESWPGINMLGAGDFLRVVG